MISTQDSHLARVQSTLSAALLARRNNGEGRRRGKLSRWKTDRTRNGRFERDRGTAFIPVSRRSMVIKLGAFPTISKVQFDEKETSRTRETLVFNEMCVERGRKLRDPFKFNVTTKLENV